MPAPTDPQPDLTRSTRLKEVVDELLDSYPKDPRTQHIDATFLPSRDEAIRIIELLRKIVFPGFFDRRRITSDNVRFHIGELLAEVDEVLYEQVRQSLRYGQNEKFAGTEHAEPCDEKHIDCDVVAREKTDAMLGYLPDLRHAISLDVQAAFDGDPAAKGTDEAVFCYPGIDAIFTHRVAHKLCTLGVPMLPRIMSEYAHNETGVDIHPGATIGESFFIDHATGVVIGETVVIGKRVKVYQGVTLGALSTKGGQSWRGKRRHPTIEDDVTIYAGATILGGDTVIGARSTIAGSVFVTTSVPPDHTVVADLPTPKVKARRGANKPTVEQDLGGGI
ncbi:MAG: serine O-acetyltransferase [Phycisphaeraceae bacterium]|nr:serine O-acetyltransferase [Phycisphaeraceae bacterium]